MRLLFVALMALAALTSGAATADSPDRPESTPSLDRYGEVLARPLFSPSRRAAVGESTSEPATELPVLQGVVLARNKRIALVAFGNPTTVRRVEEGQDIGQWHIEKIVADHIALRSPEGTTVVRFKRAGADETRQTPNSETNEQQAARSGPKR